MVEQAIFTGEHYKALIKALRAYEKASFDNPQYAKYYIAEMLRRDSSDFETSTFLDEVSTSFP